MKYKPPFCGTHETGPQIRPAVAHTPPSPSIGLADPTVNTKVNTLTSVDARILSALGFDGELENNAYTPMIAQCVKMEKRAVDLSVRLITAASSVMVINAHALSD